MNQKQFELKIKQRVYQLKRSKLFRKQIEKEMGSGQMTKEEAEAYIAKIPEIAKEEYEARKSP